MKFLTSLLTGGAKRFHDLPRDINSTNSSARELIPISFAAACSISISLELRRARAQAQEMCQSVIGRGDKSVNGRACVAT